MSSHETNWTSTLVHELVCHGANYFCIAPGSRSTPLVLAIDSHPHTFRYVHFDERALAFHALGYAKASKKPAVIVVTSGTACGNLLPAIMEAHESCIPLIILTADRPLELQECGANQTTNQLDMFSNYVRWYHAFPTPDGSHGLSYVKSTIAYAISKATLSHPGPVHLNCPFREPFTILQENPQYLSLTPKTTLIQSTHSLDTKVLDELGTLISSHSQGMFILGDSGLDIVDDEIFSELARCLKWPIICDSLSYGRHHPQAIKHYDLMLKHDHLPPPTCVIHLGRGFVSKGLSELLRSTIPSLYLHVFPHQKRVDPSHLVTHRLFLSTAMFCKQLLPYLTPASSSTYLHTWQALDQRIEHIIEHKIKESTSLTESWIFQELAKHPLSAYSMFVGNGLPIRSLMQYFHPKHPPECIYGNRGLSGIDGNIAMSVGIATAIKKPFITIIGDQACLHDCSSLSLLRQLNTPFILIVINNHGGNIFSFLPVYQCKEICETYFINSHTLSFDHLAKWFNIPYHLCQSLQETRNSLQEALSFHQHCLIEIKTSREKELEWTNHLQELFLHDTACCEVRSS